MSTGNPDAAAPEVDRRSRRRSVVAALIGNVMEFFDFAVYGFLAVVIGQVFFPGGSATAQLLSALAVFGVAFLFRPLGGAVFGYISDRFGRRVSLSGAIVLMSLSTAAIGILPGYATAGIFAPILLVAMRCLQGISVGGEFSGGSTFIAEYAPPNRRGLWVSMMSSSAALGTLLGSGSVLLLGSLISPEAMNSWGWRIPFLVAIPMGALGVYMRLRLDDTPVFEEMKKEEPAERRSPLKTLTRRDVGMIALTFVFAGATGLGFYYYTTYFNSYFTTTLGFERSTAITLNLVGLVFYAALCPLAGLLSDRIGRRRTYLTGFFAMAVIAVPAFLLMGLGPVGALLGLLLFSLPQALNNVMVSIVPVELFTTQNRVTAGAIGYNLGVGIISGTGPLVAAALVAGTGSALAPGFYLAAIVLVAGIVIAAALPETFRRSLYHAPVGESPESPATTDDTVRSTHS
ncbi:MFS transporter [Pseudonocardia halophobica]|uniref:Putative proline/betaine transporter n=1 Tax=Pseudonocardia halophobica TaxID=29401 RepID=A0A9W6L3W4_9PSEU|nr:MFS transporter [Pseudonocardia halophobica]GLL10629.1 MFS transporter [Pseudonocardia halophobica]